MIVEYVRYTIEKERQSIFRSAYKVASTSLLKSEYCQHYEFCQCIEDPSKFIVRIQWTSAQDHLEGFLGSDEFKEFLTHIKGFLHDVDEMRHYECFNVALH